MAFQQLHWIVGSWRGIRWVSGERSGHEFFAEYSLLDDSTIAMRHFDDTTFTRASDSAIIELRSGMVYYRGTEPRLVATSLYPRGVTFVPVGADRGGFTFNTNSDDVWYWLKCDAPTVFGYFLTEPTQYRMERMPR